MMLFLVISRRRSEEKKGLTSFCFKDCTIVYKCHKLFGIRIINFLDKVNGLYLVLLKIYPNTL